MTPAAPTRMRIFALGLTLGAAAGFIAAAVRGSSSPQTQKSRPGLPPAGSVM